MRIKLGHRTDNEQKLENALESVVVEEEPVLETEDETPKGEKDIIETPKEQVEYNLEGEKDIIKTSETKGVPTVETETQVAPRNKIKLPFIREEIKKAIETPFDTTEELIEKVQQTAVVHQIKNNEDIQKRVLESAEEQIMSQLEVKKNEQATKVVKASYNANKDACENLGLSEEGRPMWQIRVAKMINNFWFIVWAIISSFTLTPIIFFLKRIGTQVKSVKWTWVLTLVFYILIIGGIIIGITALAGVFNKH